MTAPKATSLRAYAPVPYEANPAKRVAWQAAYQAKEKQKVADRKGHAERMRLLSSCRCPEVGHPCPDCVAYEQAHYPDTWKARLEEAQAADQESLQIVQKPRPVSSHANREQELADKRAYRHANKEKYLGRYPYPGTLPHGQYVGHCGKFQLITQLPHTCWYCETRLFEEMEVPRAC